MRNIISAFLMAAVMGANSEDELSLRSYSDVEEMESFEGIVFEKKNMDAITDDTLWE
jgi:hypothetical protein